MIDPLGDGLSSVELIGSMGDDLTVVNAARVSYGKRSEELTERDERLISYLLSNHHGSPFEHVVFQFRVRAPLFVVQQWERHRMSNFNEESGRYIELRPDFYIKPDAWYDARKAAAEADYQMYKDMLLGGCSKEDARSVLPVSLYKEFWWTVNARSLMNFLRLRNDSHAQEEIRAYAAAIETFLEAGCPCTYRAFTTHGRVAP